MRPSNFVHITSEH